MTDPFLSWAALDRTTWPEFRDRVLAAEREEAPPPEPRSYPGYPTVALDRVRARTFASLDRALQARRSVRRLRTELPTRKQLSRLLGLSHGITGEHANGPVPSAGGLHALELYVVSFGGWLPEGAYHYDRRHLLARVADGTREQWGALVPSLAQVEGGSLLFVLVGDAPRVRAKYGPRGDRFLALEAGHLLQNLALVAASDGQSVVPLGGFFEEEVGRALGLLPRDLVLYVAAAGRR